MDELKCILLSERSQAEKVTCCMILKVRHSGKSKTQDRKKISGCQRLRGGTDERVEHRGFSGQLKLFYTILL